MAVVGGDFVFDSTSLAVVEEDLLVAAYRDEIVAVGGECNTVNEVGVRAPTGNVVEFEGGAMVEDKVLVVASCSCTERSLLSDRHSIDLG